MKMNRPKIAPSSAAAAPQGAAVLVVRQQLAAGAFVESVVEQFGLTAEQALAALEKLLKLKLVKLDAIGGRFQLKDGRFWDRVVMRRAAGLPDEPEPVVRPGSILW